MNNIVRICKNSFGQIVFVYQSCAQRDKIRKNVHFREAAHCTMCDFHNFGLIFAGQMHCLPQRLKSTLFEIFHHTAGLPPPSGLEKISKNVDFSFWGYHVTTQNTFFWHSQKYKNTFFAISKMAKNQFLHQKKKFKTTKNAIFWLKEHLRIFWLKLHFFSTFQLIVHQ